MKYKIAFKKSVSRDLKKIDKKQVDKILIKIDKELSKKADQYPELKGLFSGLRKCRIGDYRIIYTIFNDTVLILRIKHRKDVYK
ncbi:MAG: type II toxin-antitoxin system RelE/ParE family toxin [Candidatus Aminicenantes bacterium]|nr:type II toxin-antitoxin system RelE/ParE family toxin [Candidatus Aminicenantes bacterium]